MARVFGARPDLVRGQRHIYFRRHDSHISSWVRDYTARGNKSFDLSPVLRKISSQRGQISGGSQTSFVLNPRLPPAPSYRSPTDRELFSDKQEKASLRNCRGHCVFFYVTLYGDRWLFLNYRPAPAGSSRILPRRLLFKTSAPCSILTSNALLVHGIARTSLISLICNAIHLPSEWRILKYEGLRYLGF